MEYFGHIIDGSEMESTDGRRFPSINPWTREPWAEVPLGTYTEVDAAVAAARRAFDDGPWPRMGFAERGRILHRLADLVDNHRDVLATCDTQDMGKPLWQSREGDVARTVRNLRFFADQPRLAPSEVLPSDSGHHVYTRFEPAGVAGAIAPWNFPLMLESWKIAPALGWGNTVVLKPAEDTPTSATLLGRLALEAGVPPGALNVVHGSGPDSAGQALTESVGVDRITFTGESSTGKLVARAAAANLTPVSLELGGKGANMVFADADLDNAVHWSLKAIFTNAGQVCLAGSRLYVQRDVFDEFVARFVAGAEAMKIGDPMDPSTDLGPLASEQHYRKVVGYLDGINADGGKILTGGVGDSGWVVRPTVVVNVGPTARVYREEVFGPVAVVVPFDDEQDAVQRANATRYGLNAMVFTENLSRAHRMSAQLKAGTVWVNCFFVRDLRAPFGGVDDSGIGREGGNFSREFFTEPKAIVMELT